MPYVDVDATYVVVQRSNTASYQWIGENDQQYSAYLQGYSDATSLYSIQIHSLSSKDGGVSGTWTTAYSTSIIKLT